MYLRHLFSGNWDKKLIVLGLELEGKTAFRISLIL